MVHTHPLPVNLTQLATVNPKCRRAIICARLAPDDGWRGLWRTWKTIRTLDVHPPKSTRHVPRDTPTPLTQPKLFSKKRTSALSTTKAIERERQRGGQQEQRHAQHNAIRIHSHSISTHVAVQKHSQFTQLLTPHHTRGALAYVEGVVSQDSRAFRHDKTNNTCAQRTCGNHQSRKVESSRMPRFFSSSLVIENASRE